MRSKVKGPTMSRHERAPWHMPNSFESCDPTGELHFVKIKNYTRPIGVVFLFSWKSCDGWIRCYLLYESNASPPQRTGCNQLSTSRESHQSYKGLLRVKIGLHSCDACDFGVLLLILKHTIRVTLVGWHTTSLQKTPFARFSMLHTNIRNLGDVLSTQFSASSSCSISFDHRGSCGMSETEWYQSRRAISNGSTHFLQRANPADFHHINEMQVVKEQIQQHIKEHWCTKAFLQQIMRACLVKKCIWFLSLTMRCCCWWWFDETGLLTKDNSRLLMGSYGRPKVSHTSSVFHEIRGPDYIEVNLR